MVEYLPEDPVFIRYSARVENISDADMLGWAWGEVWGNPRVRREE